MKLLIATGVYPPESGGPATYSKLLEERLPVLGLEVSVLPFRVVRDLPPGIRHFAYFLICLWRAYRADAVYALDPVSVGLPAACAAWVARKKFVLRVAGDYAWEQGRRRFGVKEELDEFQGMGYGWRVEFLRRVQRWVARQAAVVVVPSEYMRGIVSTWLKDTEKIRVIYSSIALPVPVEELKSRPPGFLVVTIARPVPWKGLDGLRRVVGSERGWDLKIVDDIPRAQAMGWVKAADVFALNSTYEGLSHALIEAMSLGVPAVATRIGGNPELIEDRVTGLLIEPGDDESLRAALREVHDHKAAAQARAVAARASLKKFSIDETIGKVAALFTSL